MSAVLTKGGVFISSVSLLKVARSPYCGVGDGDNLNALTFRTNAKGAHHTPYLLLIVGGSIAHERLNMVEKFQHDNPVNFAPTGNAQVEGQFRHGIPPSVITRRSAG